MYEKSLMDGQRVRNGKSYLVELIEWGDKGDIGYGVYVTLLQEGSVTLSDLGFSEDDSIGTLMSSTEQLIDQIEEIKGGKRTA